MNDEARTLSQLPLLASVDRRTVDRLAKNASRRTYVEGQRIIGEGEAASAFYIIVRGRVRVEQSADGTRRDLGELRAGDFFGELALIEDHARTASVTAAEETECILLPVWEFKALLDEQPKMARVIMDALIRRLHRAEH